MIVKKGLSFFFPFFLIMKFFFFFNEFSLKIIDGNPTSPYRPALVETGRVSWLNVEIHLLGGALIL